MRAAVFDAPGALRLEARERPEPGPGEARVALRAAGLCAGDLYIYQGKNPYVIYPRVGGHEIAGIVDAFGPDTEGPAPGTQVVVEPFIGCGHCYACRVGKPNCCLNLRDHRRASRRRLRRSADRAGGRSWCAVPPGLTPYEASFAEPVAIGVQACRRGGIGPEDRVLVLGAGPIGLAVIEVAQVRGASVWATDLSAERLATAVELGAEPMPSGPELAEAVPGSAAARECRWWSRPRARCRRWRRRSTSSRPVGGW